MALIVKQIKTGAMENFTYIIGCVEKREGAVIDPQEDLTEVLESIKALELNIVYILNTHGHADHVAGNAALKEITGAEIVMHEGDRDRYPDADVYLTGDMHTMLGNIEIKAVHTPGHTPGGVCYYAEENLFTGDTLFVGDSGRTDLPGGDRPKLGESIRHLMNTFSGDTRVWPGHDLGSMEYSTLDWEKSNNVNAREYGFFVPFEI